jgi:hypothetical protein
MDFNESFLRRSVLAATKRGIDFLFMLSRLQRHNRLFFFQQKIIAAD